MTSILDPGNATRLSLTYNSYGQVLTETIPAAASGTGAAQTTTYAYDSTTGDLKNILNPLGEQISIGNYDPLGDARLVAVFPDTGDPATTNQALTTTVDYDAAQMPGVITDPSGTKQVTTFANGIPTQFSIKDFSNSLLSQMTLSYDTRGRVYAASDSVGTLAQYRYDKSSNLTKVIDGNNHATVMTYGHNNEPKGITWPDSRSSSLAYDAAGRLTQSTDERGIASNYLYDNADRLTDIQFPSASAQNVHTIYDDAGRVLSYTDATGGRTYNYDNVRKRVGSVFVYLGGHTYTLSYTYNPDGSVHTMTSPAGTTTYTYDALGRLTQLSNPENRLTTWTYDHAGRVTSEETNTVGVIEDIPIGGGETNSVGETDGGLGPPTTLGAVLKTLYTWGVSGLSSDPSTAPAYLRTITETVNSSPRYSYTLTHSYLGQVVAQNGTTTASASPNRYDNQTYGYDGRGRLNGENYTSYNSGYQPTILSETYNFDLSGNLLAGSGGWSYNNSNQVTSAPPASGLNGSPYLTYDYSGNLTRLDSAAENVTLSYDVWGHLSSRVGTASGTATYTYDAAGRRVSKTVGGTTTYYLYDGGMLLCELDASGNVNHAYTWGALGLISDLVNGTPRFVFSDGTGSVRALLDFNGDALGTAVYTAWGSAFNSSLPSNLPFTWCGRAGAYYDGQSGLYLMGAHECGRRLNRRMLCLKAGC